MILTSNLIGCLIWDERVDLDIDRIILRFSTWCLKRNDILTEVVPNCLQFMDFEVDVLINYIIELMFMKPYKKEGYFGYLSLYIYIKENHWVMMWYRLRMLIHLFFSLKSIWSRNMVCPGGVLSFFSKLFNFIFTKLGFKKTWSFLSHNHNN